MDKLELTDLYPLETYARIRPEFRARVIEHKAHRKVFLGEHLTLIFEDRLTMHYQVQEMLRAERIFEETDIISELEAYNPLIPDGANWKATMMIEYADLEERRLALMRLLGVEEQVWMQVEGHEPVLAIADEDLERSTDVKTSAVHFLRFEMTAAMIEGLRAGAALRAGCNHPDCQISISVPDITRESLLADFK